MCGKDVATWEEALGDGEATVGEEDNDETESADIVTTAGYWLHITHKEEKYYEAHGDASHIAGEAAGLGAEIEEAEYKDGDHDGGDELNVYESVLKEVKIAESAHHDKRIGGKHAIDAVHEVIDVEDAGEDDDQQGYLPNLYGVDVGPEADKNGEELGKKTKPCGQLTQVVDITDDGQGTETDEEVGVRNSVGERIEQQGKVEYDAGAKQHGTVVRTALVGAIDNMKTFGYDKV